MASNVVCPLSGAPNAERALRVAADIAMLKGSNLLLFGAVENDSDVAAQRHYLKRTAEQLIAAFPDLVVDSRVIIDRRPKAALQAEAESEELVVMATSTVPLIHYGYLGSAAEHVVRGSHRPTVLVGPHSKHQIDALRRIVVPVDGSDLSEAALDVATQWRDDLGLPVEVVTVLTPTDMEEARRALGAEAATSEAGHVTQCAQSIGADRWEVLHGDDAGDAIASYAGDDALVVMATHGRTGLRRLVMGSVASSVVRQSPCPVVVVRPQELDVGESAATG